MNTAFYQVHVEPRLPEALKRLPELAGNLFYSWDRTVRSLFFRIDQELWRDCGHNPTLFLRHVSEQRLEELSHDRSFIDYYERALNTMDAYLEETRLPSHPGIAQLREHQDIVAYFCAEYGLHESVKLYSGGLGVLAGDHCKAASDSGLPFVAVGLLYHQGYFIQEIDARGAQVCRFEPADFSDLPITRLKDAHGIPLTVSIEFPGRVVHVALWEARIGNVRLILLDTGISINSPQDRSITYQLYGGDQVTRIAQEIVLGIGGVRALRLLGIQPTVWHANEGHSAFQIIERCCELVSGGLTMDAALEIVAAATVFTTHTPVAAGHDAFDRNLVQEYLEPWIKKLNITLERFLELGWSPDWQDRFSMTALGLHGSRYRNSVSEIHASVTSEMTHYLWPRVPVGENPISHVTNGVHIPTFLARDWSTLFDLRYPGWRNRLTDSEFWQRCIDGITDHRFWNLRQSLKTEMLSRIQERMRSHYVRRGFGQAMTELLVEPLAPTRTDALIIGFARRFATYKRSTLLFRDRDRLVRLLGNPERPVMLLFAGKAHPQDRPGQQLIEYIVQQSKTREFAGKLFFIEDYGLDLARKLVTGVDLWLNTPRYPLEASGTSGQKAAINGVLNLSVLDGWWVEAYDGHNGWAITPQVDVHNEDERDRLEAEQLLDLLEYEIIPAFFYRNHSGFPVNWVARSKHAMKTILPYYNATRMLHQYVSDYYIHAADKGRVLAADGAVRAMELTAWKRQIIERWPGVEAKLLGSQASAVKTGDALELAVAVKCNGIEPAHIAVECAEWATPHASHPAARHALQYTERSDDQAVYRLSLPLTVNGVFRYRMRVYPRHELLAHPLEMGMMIEL
jgi:starch phosphorylase